MPVLLGLGYLAALYGVVSLASYAGQKSRNRQPIEGHRLKRGAEECWADECDPYVTMPHPQGPPGLMKCIRPQDPDWCVALGYQLELARCLRAANPQHIGLPGWKVGRMKAEAALRELGIPPEVAGLLCGANC
jgi:hypothetical protein